MTEIVEVTWRDAWFDTDAPTEWREDYLVTTVGYLVRDTHIVSVAAEQTPDGFRAVTHIPLTLVKERKILCSLTPSLLAP